MLNKRIATYCLLFSCLFSGCNLYQMDTAKPKPSPVNPSIQDERGVIPKIVQSLASASREDCIQLYEFCVGNTSVLKIADGEISTMKAFGALKEAQRIVGWPAEKVSTFNDVTEADLTNIGIKNSAGQKVGEVRGKLIEAFTLYAEGCKQAAIAKASK